MTRSRYSDKGEVQLDYWHIFSELYRLEIHTCFCTYTPPEIIFHDRS